MTEIVIPRLQRARVVAAANRAYDVLRAHVGDSAEAAEAVHRLAHECWLTGFRHGRETLPGAADD